MFVHRQVGGAGDEGGGGGGDEGGGGGWARCEAPERLEGQDWRDVSSQEFACLPRTRLNVGHLQTLQTIAGRDQAITCMIKGNNVLLLSSE